jgi:putative transposase
VEPFGAAVCCRHSSQAGQLDAWLPALALAFVKIGGTLHHLWRAVDHEGKALERFVASKRQKTSALRFLKKALKRHGSAKAIVTDELKSYPVAMRDLGHHHWHIMGSMLHNRAENWHLPFRRRELAILRLRQLKTLEKLTAIRAFIYKPLKFEVPPC